MKSSLWVGPLTTALFDSVMLALPARALGKNERIERQPRETKIKRALLFAHIMSCFLYLCDDRVVINGRITG
jgi:hypothetical protein